MPVERAGVRRTGPHFDPTKERVKGNYADWGGLRIRSAGRTPVAPTRYMSETDDGRS